MDDIAEQKAAVRNLAYQRRAAAHLAKTGQQATRHLLDHLARMRGLPLSGYMPIRTEINPLPAMREMVGFGPVGVPVIEGPGRPLGFHLWTPDGEMQAGPFGAKVPVLQEKMVPQVLILPLLAFNRAGHRLGYGGGYYDRTLEALRAAGPVHAVGFGYGAQLVHDLPTEPTDQPLDVIITENGVLHPR